MKGNIASLMQQAQKMQQEVEKAKQELAELEVTGEAGGGLVKVLMDGRHAVKKIDIDPGLLDDVEMLEDIVAAATNDAVNRLAEANEQRMGELTSGLPLPPGFKMPF
ncbi:MAG TPA: YbaB/EbfC family nucleoid-associated protein [Xanthomonadales bacterium]|nr:YbaB/EbfC family nucleoid-associated protein [Xanthomonadales bacterium]